MVFASATTGPFVARFILFFITPLPIALAGLGWGSQTAAIAGLSRHGARWRSAPVRWLALVFAVSQVVPMVVLTYLALLLAPARLPDRRA